MVQAADSEHFRSPNPCSPMTPLNLGSASLDEIVFEGRNKAYGAFQLRLLYATHLRKAVALTLALMLLTMAGVLIGQRLKPDAATVPPFTMTPPLTPEWVTITEPKIEPAAAAPVARRATPLPTTVKADHKVLTKPEEAATEPVVDGPATGPVTGPTGPAAASTGNGMPGIDTAGLGEASKPAAPAKPYISVEVMPTFMGGDAALVRYLRKNLRFPAPALREGVSGRVFVSFTVAPSGDITDVEVLKGLGFGTEEEAARVIRQMPPWQPGRQNGQNVAVRYTLPITFHYDR